MHVCKVYTPYADAATVKAAAKGADLFVTLMHGNGYPKPNRTRAGRHGSGQRLGDEKTAHGMGLNASRRQLALRYYGADWVSANLHLAPNAIVLLSHMCFTSGNSEDYDKIPDYDLASSTSTTSPRASWPALAMTVPAALTGHPSVVLALQNQSFELGRPQGQPVQDAADAGHQPVAWTASSARRTPGTAPRARGTART